MIAIMDREESIFTIQSSPVLLRVGILLIERNRFLQYNQAYFPPFYLSLEIERNRFLQYNQA